MKRIISIRRLVPSRFTAVGLVSLALTLAGCSEAGQPPLQPEETPAAAADLNGNLTPHLLVSGLEGGSGSTVGPGGALFVTESAAGRISRVDPETGEVTAFATGLPPAIPGIGIGGPIDVSFMGRTAYALVTLVGPDVGGSDVVGIYRVDPPDGFTVIADIGAFNLANPTTGFDVDVRTGVQYAIQAHRGGFLVTDGHLNRVLHVTRDGQITVLIAFGNIVPTGLDVHGNTILLAEAGPVPHLPADGKVVAFRGRSSTVREVASGAPLLVDVERGRGRTLFALSQGDFLEGTPPGFPAQPNTGALVRVERGGTFATVADELNLPTSLEVIRNTAYIVNLAGEIWTIHGIAGPPFARR